MTAQPLRQTDPAGRLGRAGDNSFVADLRALGARYASLWHGTSDAEPVPGARRGRFDQWRTKRRAVRLVDLVAREIRTVPPEKGQRSEWRARLEREIRRFGSERLDWPTGYESLVLGDEFFDSTVEFVRAARRFDPELGADDIGQALRNVWILNSLQMLLDEPVTVTPAALAYSLLYPYTDNYLDDPEVSRAAKEAMVSRLGRRLAGERVGAMDPLQDRIFRLVDLIEDEFCRVGSPDVFRSLEAIHGAQIRSLRQQRGAELSDAELLGISIAKGGASVLADGYLVSGSLGRSEADFCFGYGVFLQLLDDLQDARLDREVGHETAFSRLAARRPLDALASRLYRFMRRVVDDSSRFAAPEYADRKDLIVRNCESLLVGAVAENPDLFSRGFVRRLERRWPLAFRAMRRLRRRAERSFSQASRELRAERGVESVLDLV